MRHNTYPGTAGNPPAYEAGRQLFEAVMSPQAEVHQWQGGSRTLKTRQVGAVFSQDTVIGDMIVTVDDGSPHGKKYLLGETFAEPDDWVRGINPDAKKGHASVVVTLPPQNLRTGEFVKTDPAEKFPYGFSQWGDDGSGRIAVIIGQPFGITDSAHLRVRSVTLDIKSSDLAMLDYDYPPARGKLDLDTRPASVHSAIPNPFESAGRIGEAAKGKVRSKILGIDKFRYPVR